MLEYLYPSIPQQKYLHRRICSRTCQKMTIRVTLRRSTVRVATEWIEPVQLENPMYDHVSPHTKRHYIRYRARHSLDLTTFELMHLLELSQDYDLHDLAQDVVRCLTIMRGQVPLPERMEMMFILMYYSKRSNNGYPTRLTPLLQGIRHDMVHTYAKPRAQFLLTALRNYCFQRRLPYAFETGEEDFRTMIVRQMKRNGGYVDRYLRGREADFRCYSIMSSYP